jgi:hypothetical protein
MIKPTLENFDTVWIKTANGGKRTACIVKVEGTGIYAKHWKKQIKLADALEMIKSMELISDGSAVNRIQIYKSI